MTHDVFICHSSKDKMVADAACAVLEQRANTSPQIEREVERAVNHRVPTVPFRIEDIMPTAAMEYFISASHWLDAYSPPIDRHYQILADKIGPCWRPAEGRWTGRTTILRRPGSHIPTRRWRGRGRPRANRWWACRWA
jgi:hypothetical protein